VSKYIFKKIKWKKSKPGEESIYVDGNHEDFDTVKAKYELIYSIPGYGLKYGSASRDWIYEKLFREDIVFDLSAVSSVLDIGTGAGMFCKWAYHNICKNIYGLDFASKLSEECIDLGIKFIKASAHEIPLQDKSIDLITSFDCMEHIHPDYLEKTIDEMKRVGCRYMLHRIPNKPSKAHHKQVGQLHLIQESREFWIDQVFRPAFSNVKYLGSGTYFITI